MNAAPKIAVALFGLMTLISCSVDKCTEQNIHQTDRAILSTESDGQHSPAAPHLAKLQVPPGISLPQESDDYRLPEKPPATSRLHNDAHSQTIDIRPPIQPLTLLPGSQALYHDGRALLQLESTANSRALWRQLNSWLVEQAIKTITCNERQQTITTDWISWSRADEKQPYSARYQLTVQLQDANPTLIVKLIALWQPMHGEATPKEKKYDSNEQHRYTLLMLNRITTTLEKQRGASDNQPQVSPVTVNQ